MWFETVKMDSEAVAGEFPLFFELWRRAYARGRGTFDAK